MNAAHAMMREILEHPAASKTGDETFDRRWHGTDHDLLVRIDERLLNIKDDVGSALRQLADQAGRIEALEKWRAESEGAARVTTRTMAVFMTIATTAAVIATNVVMKVLERFLH